MTVPVTVAPIATATETPVVAEMRRLNWGVEIETVGARSRSAVAHAISAELPGSTVSYDSYNDRAEVRMVDGRVWTVMRDGSLPGGGAEVVSPIMRGTAELEMLRTIIAALVRVGARSSAADNCGIHVHVGAERLTMGGVARLAKIVAKFEPMAAEALGIASNRRGYCRAVPADFLAAIGTKAEFTRAELSRAWYRAANGCGPSRYDHSRYHGMNLNSFFFRGTVEFRWFNGTLHAADVVGYVQLALALVARAHTAKSASAKPMSMGGMSPRARMGNYIWMTLGLRGDEWAGLRAALTRNLSNAKPVAATTATPFVEVHGDEQYLDSGVGA